MENLSEEVLLRTPQESFEMLYGEVTDNTSSSSSSQRQSHQNLIIQDWQDDRKKEDGFQRQ
jgi:hypothetical protein